MEAERASQSLILNYLHICILIIKNQQSKINELLIFLFLVNKKTQTCKKVNKKIDEKYFKIFIKKAHKCVKK